MKHIRRARRPVLIVDVGGTLLRRIRPGVAGRIVGDLARIGVRVPPGGEGIATLRAMLLTSRTPELALSRLADVVSIDRRQRALLLDLLRQPDGDARPIDGGIELLATARSLGWRIVAATNAAGWVAPLPVEIDQCLDAVVASSALGVVKHETEFWTRLISRVGIEPQRTLSIGDSLDADVLPPRRCGLAALHVDHERVTLRAVARAIAGLGPPPDPCNGLLASRCEIWGGNRVIDAAHLGGLLTDVTRANASLHFGSSKTRGQLVRRRRMPPAFVLANGASAPPLLSWLRIEPDRRSTTVPDDLRDATSSVGVTLKTLEPAEQRHLISMVREAKDVSLRAERIADVVSYLLLRADHIP